MAKKPAAKQTLGSYPNVNGNSNKTNFPGQTCWRSLVCAYTCTLNKGDWQNDDNNDNSEGDDDETTTMMTTTTTTMKDDDDDSGTGHESYY